MFDRSEPARADAAFLSAARCSAASRFVVCAGTEMLLEASLPIAPLGVPGEDLEALGVDVSDSVLLGIDGDVPWFASDIVRAPKDVRPSLERLGRFVPLGSIQDPVDAETWSLLAQAQALLFWNARSQRCPTCGGPTEPRNAGYARACLDPCCGAMHFPRSDPVVIVRVTREGRCLLARQPSFRPRLRSVLAGFVEPGESLEQAVAREVEEEVGLCLTRFSYVGSQPWPFPTSLMVGFAAESVQDEIRVDGREIESAEWFTREQVRREQQDGTLVLPSAKSIARRLIDDWLNDGQAIAPCDGVKHDSLRARSLP